MENRVPSYFTKKHSEAQKVTKIVLYQYPSISRIIHGNMIKIQRHYNPRYISLLFAVKNQISLLHYWFSTPLPPDKSENRKI